MIQGWIHENIALCGTKDPAAVTGSEVFTDVINMRDFHTVLFIFQTGVWVDAETLVARVVTCDSSGNNVAALKTATTLGAHATENDNVQILIEVRGDDLPGTTNADQYIKGGLVSSAGAGSLGAVTAVGLTKSLPSTNFDLASIQEIEIDND